MARLQHIELTWQGNQRLTFPPRVDEDGYALGMSHSRRTYGLYALQDLYRLRTLVVHVNETGNKYIRRRYEPEDFKDFMTAKTQGQPNQRMTRSLRCLQGLDCIHQLRGLDWIRFYDLHKAVGEKKELYTGERVDIADWSFVEDVTNVTTMQKMPGRAETSKLKNLLPLFENRDGWAPSDEDWKIVQSYYIEEQARRSYDHLRRMGPHRDLDIPSNISSTDPTDGANSSGSDSDDSSDSDSDSSGGSRPKRPNRPRPRAGPSQTRGPSSRGGIRSRGGSTRGAPSRGRACGGGRIRLKNPRQRHEPSLEELLIEIRNQSDSESSESDDSDSELDSESASNANNRISLVTDDEEDEDNNSVIVVDSSSSSDSDSSDDLFVRQSTDGSDPNSPGSVQAEQSEREDSVIPIPWSPSLANTWRFNLPSRPQSSRGASGSTITPRPGDRRRDSASSGLFVSQSPTPSGQLGGGNRSPSVKSEDPTPLIMPDRANEMIDLTGDEVATLNLAPIMEIDDDEDAPQVADPPPIMEIDDDEDVPEVVEPPSPTGSKRSSDDRNTPDEGGDSDAPSPPKRPRTSSPLDRPANGDGDDDDDARAASV